VDVHPALEVADIFRRYGPDYLREHRLTPEQGKVLRAITRCRTAELGGHLEVCKDCGHKWQGYNSCRNRHCPKCQWRRQMEWIAGRLERMIHTHYFHTVFTLPADLRPLAMTSRRAIYALLFRTAWQTLRECSLDPQWLGAQVGVTMVLHTWTRDLRFHPHVHGIATGGGLSPDGERWVPSGQRCLVPEQVLKEVFRGKFLDGIDRLRERGKLRLDGPAQDFAHDVYYRDTKDRLHRKSWIVYAKRPFDGPEDVIKYLGRYTHRVAITNWRLISVTDEAVVFKTRGEKTAKLPPKTFIGRFLQHVLPDGFVKIRHYGLVAAVNVPTKLATAQKLCAPPPDSTESDNEKKADGSTLAELPVPKCPKCGSTNIARFVIARADSTPWPSHPRGPPE